MFGFAFQFRVLNWATFALFLIFAAAVVFRFCYPFFDPPYHNWTGDALRHWDNARYIFDKNRFEGGIDPKGFQFYLGGLYLLFGDRPLPYTIAAALMSAGTAVFWFLTARELMPERRAFEAGIFYALLPSSFLIYSFFMNEQLLIFLLGLAWWLTLVWWRRRTSVILFFAVIAWWSAILTRVIILPIGVPMMILMVVLSHRPVFNTVLTALLTLALLLPPAKFNYDRTGSWTPFGFMQVNKIYALSKHSRIKFFFNNGTWYWFECPIYLDTHQPFLPFSGYFDPKTDEYQFNINRSTPDHGMADWRRVQDDLSAKFTWSDYGHRIGQNIIFSHFDASWPESSTDPHGPWAERIGYFSRFIWAPMSLVLLWGAVFGRFTMKQSLFYGATLVLLAELILQNQGIMEGRFRKPYEPMVIVSLNVLFSNLNTLRKSQNLLRNTLRLIQKTINNIRLQSHPCRPLPLKQM